MPKKGLLLAPYARMLRAHVTQTAPTTEVDPSLVMISEKKGPPTSCTVGTTSARSRKSFCCSQLVSEMRRHP